jgi:hypothetical protein
MTERNYKGGKGSALRLMLLGGVGMLIGLSVVWGLIVLFGIELPEWAPTFLVIVVVPATLYYLWTHRSQDNTRFIPD